jgi:hypothetical protein
VGLERGPFSLVRKNDELLESKNSDSASKTEINDRGEPLRRSFRGPAAVVRSVIVRFGTKNHKVGF